MSYYFWLIFAVIALVVEMMLPTFFALFAGIGFMISAVVAYFLPDSLFVQLIAASVFMIVGAVVFKKRHFGDSEEKVVGTHHEFIGIEGVAMTSLSPHKEGEVELYEPIMGTRRWGAVSTGENLEEGTTVCISQIRGNTLVVENAKKY